MGGHVQSVMRASCLVFISYHVKFVRLAPYSLTLDREEEYGTRGHQSQRWWGGELLQTSNFRDLQAIMNVEQQRSMGMQGQEVETFVTK